jgi:hypothetical protein
MPTAVAMIHSHSAADPTDPATIAGRWLEQGAFIYFGSIHEPYLLAFRRPGLVAELLAQGLPFPAALRQGEEEIMGAPWKLTYLGDPLYRLAAESPRWSVAKWLESRARGVGGMERESWGESGGEGAEDSAAARLDRALSLAIMQASLGSVAESASDGWPAWRERLAAIPRQDLDPRRKSDYDALLIDTGRRLAAYGELQEMLEKIPVEERSGRVWAALEACSVGMILAALTEGRGEGVVLDIWDHAIRQSWPSDSPFLGQLTERVQILVTSTGGRMAFGDRLRRAAAELTGTGRPAQAVVGRALEQYESGLRPESP